VGKKKNRLPFDSRGGIVAIQRRLITSRAYLNLSAQAKALIALLHIHWRNDIPVGYGIREAAEKIPCARKTAMDAFQQLQRSGFIVMVDESLFISRTNSKARTWRLTWLPFNGRPPSNDWEKTNNSTGADMAPVEESEVQI